MRVSNLIRFVCRIFALGAILLISGCDEEFLRRLQEAINQGLITPPPGYQSQLTPTDTSTTTTDLTLTTSETSSRVFSPLVAGETCSNLLVGPPRGLACLHCMQPEAHSQAQVIVEVLVKSCLQNVAINYLVDGSFSFSEDMLQNHIDMLSSNGRRPFLTFYLTNGPMQRRWKAQIIRAFGTTISPEAFRWRVMNDGPFQLQFQALVRRLLPTIRFANEHGAIVNLIPALEDNLREKEFNKLYELALEVLPSDVSVSFGRSVCPSCYSGNDDAIPTGVFEEKHTSSPYVSVQDGTITNDGAEYVRESSATTNKLTLEDLALVQEHAGKLNNTFILWSGKRQGVYNGIYPNPKDRRYSMPSEEEQDELIRFLRDGL